MEPPNSSSLGAIGSLLRKLHELLCTEDRAQGLIGGLRKISTNLEKLSEVHDPPLTVKYWMNDARELSYDMEACVDQFVHASQPEAVSAKVAWILAWIREILGFAARVKEVNERCDRFNLVNRYIHNSSPKKVVVNHQLQTMHEEPVDPIGMEDPTNKLLEWLKPKGHGEDDLSLKVVSVLGDEGVGKSTLLKRVWRASEGTFDCRAFVQTAKRPDVRMILRSLLSQVSPKLAPKASKVPKLIDELREVLQYKRYFLVIDGLWDVSLWHIVRRALRGGNHRIVVTTAVENVAEACCRCDPNNIVNVKRLGDDQSKKLFVDTVFGFEKGCPPQFNDVTNEIIRKCGGLPLAIICTSRLAASPHGTGQEQEQQLHYVNSSLPNNLGTHSSSMEILDKVLKLCFSSLPLRLKTCLLYLSVYPETYLFLKEDLVNQWIAEDFICTPEGKDIVHVASCYFDELLNLGLIQRMDIINTNKKGLLSYTVHPAVLNFISCKSMEDNFITIIDYSQSTAVLTQKVRRLSLQFGSAAYAATPESVELSRVRSLAFMGLLSCMPLIAEFKLVRVVILNVFIEDGETKFSLSEISKLLQLRYLQVRCNVAVELPEKMQCLKHLETLEINARVEYAPSDIIHVPSLLHVRLGGKTNPTLGPIVSVKAVSSVGSSSVPSPLVYLRRFELLPPICIFQRLPEWIRHLHKLHNLEIMVRGLWPKDIDALAELPLLTHLSLYVRVPTAANIIFSRGMFSSLEYFKFVSGVLLLGFRKETMPKLRRLKLGFNAHKGMKYDNMLAGVEHLLNLQIITASIGAAPDADESDRRAAEFAFKDAIKTHPCHRTFKEAKRVDRVDEEFDSGMMVKRELADTRSSMTQPLDALEENRPRWKLAFRTPPQLRIFTGSEIKDRAGHPLEVILVDADTGSPAAIPQALPVELVPVLGDFPPDGCEDWTAGEFQTAVVKEREGKRPLLAGQVSLTMRDGCATLWKLRFTDNPSWVRCRKFRIGVRVVPGSYDGPRIQEALTEAFVVRDSRSELKHYPPVLADDVWRLEKIGKDGWFHRRLNRSNIWTVQEFVRMLMVKPTELRAILGDCMTESMWKATTEHAMTCEPDNRVYVYSTEQGTVYVNSIFKPVRVVLSGVELPLEQLNVFQKAIVQWLLLEAYDNRHELQETHATDNTPLLPSSISTPNRFS
ncbi:hypothetical protein BS78_K313300 [Paspalum vaginatum]|uniref:NB-ARC domain-containing protein n=1 Tax=Paspalum vaginatum TaxID=158149 RepID=A0A9W7XED6_9POAL|nr:hypothetical protein BS78_K313300 [Paspalum vaginatum]